MPQAGQVVGGRYRLVRPLGEGGMAFVWAAEHLTMGNLVALKIISPDLVRHPVAIARFRREAQAAARLRSPYVVQIYDHDVDADLGPFIAMELLEGESVASRLARDVILSPVALSRIILQVAKALMRAHNAGIVHRDMKPDNIFLVPDEEGGEIAKVLDFGVAKADSPLIVHGASKTVAGTLLGTLHYMSPEQAQGKDVDYRTDLWALGIIAFEALVGRRPYAEKAPGALVIQICVETPPVPSGFNSGVPDGFDEWFAKACHRAPEHRFQSALELARALADICHLDTASGIDPTTGSFKAVGRVVPAECQPATIDAPPKPQGRCPLPQKPQRKRPVLEIIPSIPPGPSSTPRPAPEPKLALVPSDRPSSPPERADGAIYYVLQNDTSVGPLSLEALRAGYLAGQVSGQALVWTEMWPSWRQVTEVLPAEQQAAASSQARHGIESLGPACVLPAGAPTPAPGLGGTTLPAPAAASPRRPENRSEEPLFFVTDKGMSVGPVKASVLRQGLQSGRVPWTAILWREGWDRWKSMVEAISEIEIWECASEHDLRDGLGIESVGSQSLLPPTAPPPVAPNKPERSK